MFDKAFVLSGETEWAEIRAEKLAADPTLTEGQLAEMEAEFWADFYTDADGEIQ